MIYQRNHRRDTGAAMIDKLDPEITRILRDALRLEAGPARLALLEEAVRIADSTNDVAAGFFVRNNWLMWAALASGQPEKMLVNFSWCRSQCDRDPEQFPENELLFKYRHWVTTVLRNFPQFSRQQIQDAFDDLTIRFQRCGRSLRGVYKERCETAVQLGDFDVAEAAFQEWQRLPLDDEWDDAASECNDEAEYIHNGRRDVAGALQHLEPIFQRRLKFRQGSRVPLKTFASFLRPLCQMGRWDDAMKCHLHGYPLIARLMHYIGEVGSHIEFLALTGNLTQAVKMFERHWPDSHASHEVRFVFDFRLGSRFLLERLRDAGHRAFKLRAPKDFPLYQESGEYDLDAVIGWFTGEIERVAAAFNARAGNTAFSAAHIAPTGELAALAKPHPLPTPQKSTQKWSK